ncbi:hypothetical protein VQ042_24215, partial [Aurantimonas sp. A2-1-M11]|uniref:hypothetical protein n=1 Tax=Aurantimonas sp. A2-1-M11 TaxID=3113712 RepID=UPI002F921967
GARIIKPFPAGDKFFHGILPTAKIRRPSEESIATANAREQSDYKNFQMRFPWQRHRSRSRSSLLRMSGKTFIAIASTR